MIKNKYKARFLCNDNKIFSAKDKLLQAGLVLITSVVEIPFGCFCSVNSVRLYRFTYFLNLDDCPWKSLTVGQHHSL